MKSVNKNNNKKLNILVVYYGNKTTFIQRDMDILKKHYQVDEINIKYVKDLILLLKKILLSDIIYIWFAGKHAGIAVLIGKLFGKKSILIIGGYDAAKVPEINYGLWAVGSLSDKLLAKLALKHSDKILVVDQSLKDDLIKNSKIKYKEKDIVYIPTGYDPNYWKPAGKKENIVLTVSVVKRNNLKRKGLITFVKAAKFLPNVKFVVVGKFADSSIDILRKMAGKNVIFTGFISDKELLRYYQKSKVYCQLSRYEGLPNALCEAMLCECIPVGTHYCGIPTAIGDTGFYVPYGDIEKTVEAIKMALNSPPELGKKARERIMSLFPSERREKELIKIMEEIL